MTKFSWNFHLVVVCQSEYYMILTAPKQVKKRIYALKLLQKQHDMVRKARAAGIFKAGDESLVQDLYGKRFEIVNGIMDVDTINNETLKEIPQYCPEDEAVKGIPDFWLNVLRYYDWIEVTEADEKVLAFLQDIRICHLSNPNRIRLEFLFECNPYFKNTVLTKTYHVQTDGKKSYMRKAIGTEIEWYFGQSPKKLLVRNKPKKGSQKTKPVIEFESCESFFYYFTTSEDAKYVLKDEPKNDKRDDKECCGGDHDDDHRNADDDADKSKLEVVIVMTRTKEMKLIVKMMMMSTMVMKAMDTICHGKMTARLGTRFCMKYYLRLLNGVKGSVEILIIGIPMRIVPSMKRLK